MSDPRRIDIHHHLIPPDRGRAIAERAVALGWPAPTWDKDSALAMMDHQAIAVAVLSYAAPLTAPDDTAAAPASARSVNEYTAELVKDRPERFGHFAALPLPDVDAAVAEAAYALDELGADGVILMSNIGGHYLGEGVFEPLWAELDARGAVVLVHPTAPPGPMVPGLPSPLVDFPHDTTRTALHMAVNGVLARHREVKVILPHAGGFLPYAAQRFAAAARLSPDTTPEHLLEDLRRFYFDTAFSAAPATLPSLLAFAAPGHILYGSDFPMIPTEWAAVHDTALEEFPHWDPGQLHGIHRANAEALIPRLASVGS
ncbi:amidohydrolase family protein [Streptomyces aureoverticillatus]|uniref:amidohydrolase family protein n=1 Tax=Streptomyces aureoverticillatus TaxID=66871 RepID=UPI0013DC1DFF|nr:amidohydrolase family protein [Streptomyces aureoverticillatus]QIB41806.1 amidohydrolase [Streptomyces aureoverticillatus]